MVQVISTHTCSRHLIESPARQCGDRAGPTYLLDLNLAHALKTMGKSID